MAQLHYSSKVTITMDRAATKRAMESIGAHASRGGWVTVSDTTGREWSLLVSAGIPIWINDNQ
jgi:hypothetical protein